MQILRTRGHFAARQAHKPVVMPCIWVMLEFINSCPGVFVHKITFLLILIALCSACERYAVTFNERVVYQPPTLLVDYSFKDPVLSQCVTETINNRKIQRLDQLTDLRCPNTEIRILDGLETFIHITVLDLSFTKILNVEALSALTQLRQLNLKGASMLNCDSLANLKDRLEQLILPDHCQP